MPIECPGMDIQENWRPNLLHARGALQRLREQRIGLSTRQWFEGFPVEWLLRPDERQVRNDRVRRIDITIKE